MHGGLSPAQSVKKINEERIQYCEIVVLKSFLVPPRMIKSQLHSA
jgi:hypothetical protein